MTKVLLLLGVLCCCGAAAVMAGPNAGGVLWVHDTGLVTCTDNPVWPPDPADCRGVDAEMPVTIAAPMPMDGRYWNVYAAFPVGSSPRLNSVGWGTAYDTNVASAYSYVNVLGGDRSNGETAATVFFIGGNGFPIDNGGTIGQSFPQGARTTLVTPLFMFWGFGYNYDPATYPCPTWSVVAKVNDDNFGDDNIPANVDPIMGYGTLGFGCPGFTPCPVAAEFTGACCNLALGMPNCTITTAADCHVPFTWQGADVPCNVEACPVPPPPTGNCCNHAIPQCLISTQAACVAAGSEWLGAVACDVLTNCQAPVIPTGACCNTAIGFPVCNITTAAQCGGLGTPWVYLGDSIPCNALTCSMPAPSEGACCWLDGHCTITLEADCLGDGTPRWTSGGTCSPNLCDMPTVPTGACCWLDGYCTVTTAAGCLGNGTPHWTADGTCEPNECTPATPTERTSWGQIKNTYR